VLSAPGRARTNGVELKAERRKPSGEKHSDIEDIPSLTGVLAHFRLHQFNGILQRHSSMPFGARSKGGQVQGRPVPYGRDREFGKN
jgi:hypothetical protein